MSITRHKVNNIENKRVQLNTTAEENDSSKVPKEYWYKVYILSLFDHLSFMKSKELLVLSCILRNMDPGNNLYLGRMEDIKRDILELSNNPNQISVTIQTINAVITKLRKNQIIARKMIGQYMVNPKIITQGDGNKASELEYIFDNIKKQDPLITPKITNKPIATDEEIPF